MKPVKIGILGLGTVGCGTVNVLARNALEITRRAGREIRVFIHPQKIDDLSAYKLAKDIANKIEAELSYPGEVKVTVIRETRVSEYAR